MSAAKNPRRASSRETPHCALATSASKIFASAILASVQALRSATAVSTASSSASARLRGGVESTRGAVHLLWARPRSEVRAATASASRRSFAAAARRRRATRRRGRARAPTRRRASRRARPRAAASDAASTATSLCASVAEESRARSWPPARPAAASRADLRTPRDGASSRVASHRVRLRAANAESALGRGARLVRLRARERRERALLGPARRAPRSPPRARVARRRRPRTPRPRPAARRRRDGAPPRRPPRAPRGPPAGAEKEGDVRGVNMDSSACARARGDETARRRAKRRVHGDARRRSRRDEATPIVIAATDDASRSGRATFEKAARRVRRAEKRAATGGMAVGVRGFGARRGARGRCGDRSRTERLATARARRVGRRFEIASADRAGEETVAFSPHTRVFRPPPVARGSSAISSSRGAGSVTKPKRGSLASRARSPPGRAARRRHISGRAPPTSSRTPGGYRISRASRDVRADPRLQPALQGAAALPRRRGTSRIAVPRDRKKSVPSAAFDRSRWRSVPPARVALAPSFSRRTRRPVRVPLAPRAARLLRPPWSLLTTLPPMGPPLPSSPARAPLPLHLQNNQLHSSNHYARMSDEYGGRGPGAVPARFPYRKNPAIIDSYDPNEKPAKPGEGARVSDAYGAHYRDRIRRPPGGGRASAHGIPEPVDAAADAENRARDPPGRRSGGCAAGGRSKLVGGIDYRGDHPEEYGKFYTNGYDFEGTTRPPRGQEGGLRSGAGCTTRTSSDPSENFRSP